MKTILKYYSAGVCLGLWATVVAQAIPVTFQVDMSATAFDQFADQVDVRGAFNEWNGGFLLLPSANPNILTNTFDIADPAGTVEYYKFTWNSNFELQGLGNRPFTLGNAAQTLPPVYFSDVPPAAPATTNSITFRVNMSPQIVLGNFDTNNDTVTVAGTFQAPSQWAAGVFHLTNSGANNLYVGTYTNDGNYPRSYEEFKFIISHPSYDSWESINNRSFILTNHGILPVVYFNDVGSAVPVTFKVDLSAQAAAGRFFNGLDIVECKGSFNGWLGGFMLTNDPSALNINLFSGTTFVLDAPGTTEFYRFTVDGGFSGLGWETPGSTDGYDRSFIQPANATTLPTVAWSDWTPSDVLPSNTTVTFTLNMTNAVGTDGHVFDPFSDSVFLNGDWVPWWTWGQVPSLDLQLFNNPPGSLLYSVTVSLPGGYAVPLSYKYSINGFDDEAGFGTNHLRYVRALGTYALPMDTFGSQLHESTFGNLTASPALTNRIRVSWLGRPGVRLQTATNLDSPVIWQDHPETAGLSSTNYLRSGPRQFFRLAKP